jgi:hypothetical protein
MLPSLNKSIGFTDEVAATRSVQTFELLKHQRWEALSNNLSLDRLT